MKYIILVEDLFKFFGKKKHKKVLLYDEDEYQNDRNIW